VRPRPFHGRRGRPQLHHLAFLATTHCSTRTTARPRVRARSLPTRRHASPVPKTAVTADVHEALDVHRDFATQVALDPHLFVDDLANPIDLIIRQITHARVRIDIRALEQLLARMQPDAKDIRQRRLNPLIARKIDSCNSRHVTSPLSPRERGRLTLTLLVPWIDANHPNYALASDDFAILATTSHRSSHFHNRYHSCSDLESSCAR
jgi:hypothetical protein